jgi:uncharacterized hydrophobic protein (TIGR00271 family)
MSAIEHEQSGPTNQENIRSLQRHSIRDGAKLDFPYILMNTLSAVIASYGLLENSPAVVIGAMIIAMLLGPIAGTALSLVDGDNASLLGSAVSLLCGVAVVLVTGIVIGLIHRDIPVTDEILSRTTPNLMDLMIALAGGAAGGFATVSTRLSVAFVGVAIATALVPPICSGSILFARGEFRLGLGAYLLAFTNIVAIQVAFSVVLWCKGFRRVSDIAGLNLWGFLRRHLVSVALLGVLAFVLTENLQRAVAHEVFEGAVRHALRLAISRTPGSYLADVHLESGEKSTIIRAVVRGPRQPSVGDVAALAASLPPDPGGAKLELRVRFVQTVTVTPQGVLSWDAEPDPAD